MLTLVALTGAAAPSAARALGWERSLRVVTYNIHHGVGTDGMLDLERIAAVLAATEADVIALQEVDRHWSERSELADQATELSALLDMQVVYGANLDREPLEPGQPRRQYGTALLTTHAIVSSTNTLLPNLGGEQRGLLDVVIRVRGVPVRILNTHLQHDDAAERAAQTEAIAQRIDLSAEPVVLVGDLNAGPGDAELAVLQARLADAWKLAGRGAGATYPSEAPEARIDYVMTDRCLEVRDAEVVSTLASDHLPLVAEIELASRARLETCRAALLPLARAHAHNDYEHERPLLDALEQGFTSVEADVWLVDGELLVAHDFEDVDPGKTLESLYLRPLAARIRAQGGGRVHARFPHSLQLLIDIKSDAEPTYRALHAVLARYAGMLTWFTPLGTREGAVTAVMSGNRPRALMAAQTVRFAGYDGRASDLGAGDPASFIPLISDRWTNLFSWVGEGEMPAEQRQKLHDFVATAHANGQRVRFWATPEDEATREAVWTELVRAGVDYINTDHLPALRTFLLVEDTQPSVPTLDWFGPLWWFDTSH